MGTTCGKEEQMKGFWWLGMSTLALMAGGCALFDTGISQQPDTQSEAPPVDDYRIGVDDRVQVSVWRNPELTVTAPVRPDGKISVPIIGDVQAGGLTAAQVSEEVKKRLSEYIREPNVAVIITELRSHEFLTRVRVTGAVRTPRSLPHRQGMTVLDAVLEAGGLNEFASPNRAKLYRKVKDRTEVFDISLGDILTKGRLQTNLVLRPGDVITVPERLF
jgi:polysaccharide export outer membrane protein